MFTSSALAHSLTTCSAHVTDQHVSRVGDLLWVEITVSRVA